MKGATTGCQSARFFASTTIYCFELQMRQVQIVDLAGSERLKPYEDGSQQDKARRGDGELVKQGIFLGDFFDVSFSDISLH